MRVVFDIGGTNMRVAATDGETLGEIRKVPTPKDPKEGIATLVHIVRELDSSIIESAAGDVAGSISREGTIFDATNLPAWEGVNIAEEISRALGAPVRVLNDAVVVGFGEAERGSGKGFPVVAYITVSTGVGGARINRKDLSKSVLLAEFGALKQRLHEEVSGTAVSKKFGIHPKELDSIDERNRLADILAEGLAELAAAWKPDVFVLGGSMIVGINPIPLERVQETLHARSIQVPVRMAELGDNGGLYGAAALLR